MNAPVRIHAANDARFDLPMSVVTRAALALPPLQQIELLRLLTGEFTWSLGSDEVDRGIDMILVDFRDGAEAARVVGYDALSRGGVA